MYINCIIFFLNTCSTKSFHNASHFAHFYIFFLFFLEYCHSDSDFFLQGSPDQDSSNKSLKEQLLKTTKKKKKKCIQETIDWLHSANYTKI